MPNKRQELLSIIAQGDTKLLNIMYAVAQEYLREPEKENRPDIRTSIGSIKADRIQTDTGEAGKLYRLVYTSARSSSCDEECVKDILEASRRNNAKLGITGMLIHTKDRFLQILEGPYEKVTALYNKISKDPRHGGSLMRFCEPVKERHFGDWNMAYKAYDSDQVQYNTLISEESKQLYASLMDGDLHNYKDAGMRVLKVFLQVS